MIVYTTCRRCGGLLHTTDGDTVHPLCEPKPTPVEKLTQEWLAAVETGNESLEQELYTLIEDFDSRPPRLAQAALTYASWGWPVFPLKPVGTPCSGHRKCAAVCQCPKEPLRGSHGFEDATTDFAQITSWWEQNPGYNIGLATGHRFDVLDFDVPDGIPELHKAIQSTRAVHGWGTTASGGTHLYVKPTGRGNLTRWLPGTDYRGLGGYVVCPPSRLAVGGWSWRHVPSPVIRGQR